MTPYRSDEMVARQWSMARSTGSKVHIVYPKDYSSWAIQSVLDGADSDVLFLGDPLINIEPAERMLERMAVVMRETGCGLVYADGGLDPRIDYQRGSIRDGFDFGPVIGLSVAAARQSGIDGNWKWGGLYDLRLRISEKYPIVRVPEPLYTASSLNRNPAGQNRFDYVDPRNREYQLEMERIATAHLKRIGAWLPPSFERLPVTEETFALKASIIIPVRNRERTILDAVRSALAQRTDFDFNVIVVDNHSTDRTPEILRGVDDARLKHVVPVRKDLGIGGCWNEAIYSCDCGKYAVQLDSDDLYTSEDVLARLVAEFEAGPYAMVIGSYTVVDFSLKEIPPGLIDHREWTRDNGRNNALRVNGLGAPRAFHTAVLRQIGFPNVSYGEDYAVALRISRDYEIGRIYESVYLCRRWEGNSDSTLPVSVANEYDRYKDWLRTIEIEARRRAGRADPGR
jgi:Glycosyl transferase family 2